MSTQALPVGVSSSESVGLSVADGPAGPLSRCREPSTDGQDAVDVAVMPRRSPGR